jgi:Secretion system C-terminal sorting domain/Beta-propeller repeat
MKYLITILILSFSSIAFAQNCQWAQREGGTSTDYGWDIVSEENGNTYSVGEFIGTYTSGCSALNSAGNQDIYIQKRDRNGNCLWSISEGSTGQDFARGVALDTSGFIYVTGAFSGTIQFPTDTLTSIGFTDLFLAKYDTAGTCIWARRIGGVPQTLFYSEYGNQVTLDVAGNVLVLATTDFTATVYKYDSNGNSLWNQVISGGAMFGEGVVTDKNANVYVAFNNLSGGQTFTSCDTIPANLNITPQIAKFDQNGNCVWAKNIGLGNATITGYANDITIDSYGNLYLTGGFNVSSDFGCGLVPNAGASDIYIKKIDTNGVCIWTQQAGGTNNEFAYGISVKDSVVQISGYFIGTCYFPNDTLIGVGSFRSGYVAEWDTAGNYNWANEAGLGNNHCEMRRVSTDMYGNAYITGNALANPVVFQCATLNAVGGQDAVFARYSPPCVSPIAEILVDSVCLGTANTFTSISSPGNAPLVSWNWDITGDSIGNLSGISVNNTYSNSGPQTVLFYTQNDCGLSDTTIKTLEVYALPNVNLGNDTMACAGNTITLDAGNFISYLWNDNSTNQTLNVSSTDTVWVQVSDTNGCAARDTIVVNLNICTSVQTKNVNHQLAIYPNPFNNVLTIENEDVLSITVEVINVAGQTVLTSKTTNSKTTLNTENLTKGMYLLKITDSETGELLSTQKVINQ